MEIAIPSEIRARTKATSAQTATRMGSRFFSFDAKFALNVFRMWGDALITRRGQNEDGRVYFQACIRN